MTTSGYYKATDKMSNLICDNYELLQVMSRFGISLGFGDKNVAEVCDIYGVDCETFLTVVNFLSYNDDYGIIKLNNKSILSLISYLKDAHQYFMEYAMPSIREKLLSTLKYSDNQEVSFLIINFFDSYYVELRKHMTYEDTHVFPYVNQLINNERDGKFKFSDFANSHDQLDTKLTELKDIIIKYLSTKADNLNTNALLYEIFSCIKDLDSHSRIEDCIFIPSVFNLEKEMESK